MFTGIVQEMGRVAEVSPTELGLRIRIETPTVAAGLSVGDSVAVNGVCLTVVGSEPGWFACDVVKETLDRTNLGGLEVGSSVDLERPIQASGRFDGHIVQGHVDATGRVRAVVPEGESVRMSFTVPPALERYLVEKGSITVDGVSLTVNRVEDDVFEVNLIPHTLAVTTLGRRAPGDFVNLEGDILAKYVAAQLESR